MVHVARRQLHRPVARLLVSVHLGIVGLAWLLFVGCDEPQDPSQPPYNDVSTSTPAPFFTDVTHEAGLAGFRHETGAQGRKWFPETMGAGGGFVDYDTDGWPDILLVGGNVWPNAESDGGPALRLYRNNGDGTFTETTSKAGLESIRAYGMGVTAADYDNDGDADIFFTTLQKNLLLRNDGGTFREVSRDAGTAGTAEWSTAALFFDADGDGHLDLFVGNYVDWTPENDVVCTLNGEDKSYCTPEEYDGIPPQFYRNNGDGTFTERTEAAGFRPASGKTLGVTMLDYNRDGRPDVAVANDQQRDLLYENQGGGTFIERGVLSGIAFSEEGRARAGMGIDAGVVDETGHETILVGNFSNEMIGVYRHVENGLFTDRAAESRIGYPSLMTLTFGLFLFDVDLDGDLDLLAANGHVQEDIGNVRDNIGYRQLPQLFLNSGKGLFTLHEPGAASDDPLGEPMVARGAAYPDYDRDGDLDVLITENGGPAHLWRSNTRTQRSENEAHVVSLAFEGSRSNRDGIGASVVASLGGQHLRRRVATGSSYLSHSDKNVVLGMGAADRIDTLWVHWPSGQIDRHLNVASAQAVRIVEGEDALHSAVPLLRPADNGHP